MNCIHFSIRIPLCNLLWSLLSWKSSFRHIQCFWGHLQFEDNMGMCQATYLKLKSIPCLISFYWTFRQCWNSAPYTMKNRMQPHVGSSSLPDPFRNRSIIWNVKKSIRGRQWLPVARNVNNMNPAKPYWLSWLVRFYPLVNQWVYDTITIAVYFQIQCMISVSVLCIKCLYIPSILYYQI